MSKKDKKLVRESINDNSATGLTRGEVVDHSKDIQQSENDPRQKQPSRVITSGDVKGSSFRNLPTININVFAQISGIKPDQLAGFYYYAKRNDIKRLTRPEWEAAYKKFMTLPVK